MKYLLVITTILLMGCNSEVVELFLVTHKNGCTRVPDVKIQGIDYGNFVLCTKIEYDRRTK